MDRSELNPRLTRCGPQPTQSPCPYGDPEASGWDAGWCRCRHGRRHRRARGPWARAAAGLWVDPRHRCRGVAQALISQAVGCSRDHQARELIAWVAEDNTAARLLYARVGFRPAGARQPLPSNPAVEETRLPLLHVQIIGTPRARPATDLVRASVVAARFQPPAGLRAANCGRATAAMGAVNAAPRSDPTLGCSPTAAALTRRCSYAWWSASATGNRTSNEDKGWCSPREVSSVAHHPAGVTSNDASMTSRRPQPSDTPVSLVGGAPRRNRTGDPILTMEHGFGEPLMASTGWMVNLQLSVPFCAHRVVGKLLG
jgi:GNAT superfamily N-acetyltransferase